MRTVDWIKFPERVSAGTIARSVWGFDVMLLENYPYSALDVNINHRAEWERADEDHQEIGGDRLKCQRIISESLRDAQMTTFIDPDCLSYLVKDQWLTFEQVMA